MGRGERAAAFDFEWSPAPEPHAERRRKILEKYPEVAKLNGPCPYTKWKVLFAVCVQLCMCAIAPKLSFWPWFLCTYMLGGTINHSMTLAMHEISHNLAFRKPLYNRMFGMVASLPLGVPAFAPFVRYHMEHHKYQGEDFVDGDVPTEWEGRFFRGTFMKVVWMILQPAFYALRPMCVSPRVPNRHELVNIAVQLTFNVAIVHFFGIGALLYLFMGTILGMGLHPLAGHFVAEHYAFVPGQETYSYYGPLNWVSFNVGYHNEHHDFPYVAGSRLPKLREIAHEFYDTLPHHTSWSKVIWKFITDPAVTPFSRVKRRTVGIEKLETLNPMAAARLQREAAAKAKAD